MKNLSYESALNRIEARIQEIQTRFNNTINTNKSPNFQEIWQEQIKKTTYEDQASSVNLQLRNNDLDELFNFYADKYGLDPNLAKAVAKAESGFNPKVVSSAGAQGIMQLMPGTAKALGVTDPFDLEQNISGGVRYLRGMLDKFGGNTQLALAAYNSGPGNVEKYGGIPPFKETKNYVNRVQQYYQQMKQREE